MRCPEEVRAHGRSRRKKEFIRRYERKQVFRKGVSVLKHLICFENLLLNAQNELVTKAVEEGKHALGYNCCYLPEVLLNLDGCFSTRQE